MQLLFHADIYNWQSAGGITRIYNNVLPRCSQLSDNFAADILLQPGPAQIPPHSTKLSLSYPIESRRWLRPSKLWAPAQPYLQKQLDSFQWQRLQRSADVFHPSYYWLPPSLKLPVVVMVYDMIHERYPQWFDNATEQAFVQRKHQCIKAADAVICISAATKQDVAKFCGVEGEHVSVAHLAHDSTFQPGIRCDDAGTGNSEPFLLYVGARLRYKNFGPLIAAFAAQSPIPILRVVGPAWTREEQQQIAALGCSDRVQLHTGVSDEQLLRLYQQALALVYPSAYEGFGIPLLEAMASGCPLIASDIPSTREVAANVPCYIEPDRPDSWQQAFEHVLDSHWRIQAQAAGIEHAAGYHWDRCAKNVLSVYQQFERG